MPYEFLLDNPAYMYALIIAALLFVAAVLIWYSTKLRRDAARHEARAAEEQARAAEEHARAAEAEASNRGIELQELATQEAEAQAHMKELELEERAQRIDQMHVRKSLIRLEEMIYRYNAFMFDTMSGLEFENFFADLLRRNQYTDVQVTQASGDYGGDVIATDPSGERICFQCKYHAADVGVSAVQEVFTATKYYKCDRGAVVTRNSYTRNARELAEKIGVTLHDGHFVSKLMECCLLELRAAAQDKEAYYIKQAAAYAHVRNAAKASGEEFDDDSVRKPFSGKDKCAVNPDKIDPQYIYIADSDKKEG